MIATEEFEGVTVATLDHGKVNAFDSDLMKAWISELDRLEQSDTKALVLTGGGKVFSAGVDLRRLTEEGRDYVEMFLPLMSEAFLRTFTFSRPVVAAVNGHAIAGGCMLACACDYRVMSEGSGRIGTPELAVGVPFPSIAVEILRLMIPNHLLQTVIYRGVTCTPGDALTHGFVDEISPPDVLVERAIKMAVRLGSLPAASFALTKRLIREPSRERVVQYMQSIDKEILDAWMSPTVQAAIQRYVEETLKK